MSDWIWSQDGWVVLVGSLCAVAAALLGNFLVLRRMSMLGDAVTHAVLPGIVVAFLISGTRSNASMFAGAVIVGGLTALFTEWIRRFGKVDEGASMGVVFTSLFALGLVLLVQVDDVDLDPDCVLYGSIELTPIDTIKFLGHDIPRAVFSLSWVVALNLSFVILFFKELKISTFDPALATTMGFSARLMHYSLMILVSVTAVASFNSVGSILVVAMFIVPAAAAYMLTDRLAIMIGLSVLIGILSAVGGHVSAITVPRWFGFESTTTAGMMAVASGGLFLLAALLGPQHGVLVKWFRRQLLRWRIIGDDIVATLYRAKERSSGAVTFESLTEKRLARPWVLMVSLHVLRRRGDLATDGSLSLTPAGYDRGRRLVRSHRLWEQYLVTQTGAESDQIHGKAEKFEHFTDRLLRDELDRVTEEPSQDPHGRPIPSEQDSGPGEQESGLDEKESGPGEKEFGNQ